MPKILRIINRLNLGGPTYNVAYLTKFLAPEFETKLLAGMKDESEASSEFILKDLGVEPTFLSQMHRTIALLEDWKTYREIIRYIKEFKPDIVHTHAAKAGTLGRLAALKCKVPVIVHTFHGHVFHSYFNKMQTRFFIMVERYLAARSSGIIALSNSLKKELTEAYRIANQDKFKVIPLGFDLARFTVDREGKRRRFRDMYGLRDTDLAIGIVGRIVPIKHHALFLRSFNEVASKTSQSIKAFIIGDGVLKNEMMHLCEELELSYSTNDAREVSVIFTSWIENIDAAYAGLDIIALSSLNEGTPVSLIEAQAAAKPIVSTNVGGVRDTVISGKTALLCPSGHIVKFSEALLKFVTDQALRKEMSLNGKEHVFEKYSYTRLVEDMRTYYTELLAQI